MALLAEEFIDHNDIILIEQKYNSERSVGRLTVTTQFQYASCLVRSKYKDDIQKGIALLVELCRGQYDTRDFLFFLAVGHYKLGNLSEASKFIQRLLTIEPNNYQAQELKNLIDSKTKKDAVVGIALTSGVVALGGVLLGLVLAKKSN